MNFWKKFAIIFTSISFYLFPTSVSHSCAHDPGFQGYNFFDIHTVNTQSTTAPYILSFSEFYKKQIRPTKDQIDANVLEWRERFCNLVKLDDIRQVIYRGKLGQLKTLQTSVRSKGIKLNAPFKNNTFARHLKTNRCIETIDYIVFAKECEPHAIWQRSWEQKERNVKAMERLIKRAKTQFSKVESHYIKLRYAFQAIRLAHYAKKYEEVLELYDFFSDRKENDPSIIDYWILGHKAGALQALGNDVESAHLYTQIFLHCPSKRTSAYRSFRIKTDDDWKHVMELCHTEKEKATMHVLRAGTPHSNLIHEMDAIYDMDPNNEHLELFLVKEIHKLEKDFMGYEFNDQKRSNKKRFGIPRKDAGKKLIELSKFVRKVVQDEQIPNIDLWRLSEGYLELLASDFYAAEKSFIKAKKEMTDEKLLKQLSIFELALKINLIDEPDEEDEEEIAEIMRRNKHYRDIPIFKDFLSDKLADVYMKDAPGKAFLIQNDLKDLVKNPKMETIENLLEICSKAEPTPFEEFLCEQEGTPITDRLRDLKGNLFLKSGKPEAALAIFKEIPRISRQNQKFNPFREMMVDCHNCEIKNDTFVYLDKVEVLERIFDLEFQGRSDFENGDLYFYELGIAYYNMTYFGHSWKMMDNFRSSIRFGKGADKYGKREMLDCSKAMEYFEKVIDLTKDEELKARTFYMAAKIEHIDYYLSKDYRRPKGRNVIPAAPDKYQTYFKRLNRECRQTEFYKEAIRECKYFEAFTRN